MTESLDHWLYHWIIDHGIVTPFGWANEKYHGKPAGNSRPTPIGLYQWHMNFKWPRPTRSAHAYVCSRVLRSAAVCVIDDSHSNDVLAWRGPHTLATEIHVGDFRQQSRSSSDIRLLRTECGSELHFLLFWVSKLEQRSLARSLTRPIVNWRLWIYANAAILLGLSCCKCVIV